MILDDIFPTNIGQGHKINKFPIDKILITRTSGNN